MTEPKTSKTLSLPVKALIKQIHHDWAVPKGWWTDLTTGEAKDRDIDELLMLVVSELAEAMEGVRKDLMDDKLPEHKMEHVEIADTLIRLFDLAGGKEIDCTDVIAGGLTFDTRRGKLPALKRIVKQVVNNSWYGSKEDWFRETIRTLLGYCENFDIPNIQELIQLKMDYNETREDHKLENRRQEGGKQV